MKDEILITEFELRLLSKLLWKELTKVLAGKYNDAGGLLDEVTICFTDNIYLKNGESLENLFRKERWLATFNYEDIRITLRSDFKKVEIGKLNALLHTLAHELVHFFCFRYGFKFKDGEFDFENFLSELKILSNIRSESVRVVRDFKSEFLYEVADILPFKGDNYKESWGDF